ncbi:bacteriophage abortive infection AbiH family protein [Enterococcus sp. BWT-B8]|uniref:bacteriophage abortive infection AbiH family protein n=1 Tax=Enterococcus sp. BWT-B8 TaxID=2885157 RepID=UPI001E343D80|nr:bacteriophage abortive infection AbiH family protein [Enterococcus sp. BWT-B8]MCB5953269.1 bacteriophage abortive infection AbiH family protein [Enterococcus sp. BWT-B8]
MKLFIIGNGFDLYHGLPTNYSKFILFLKDNYYEVYEGLIKVIGKYSTTHFTIDVADKGYNWAELEDMIGSLEPLELVEEYRDWRSPNDYNGGPNKEIEKMLNFGMKTSSYLSSWIKEVNQNLDKVEKVNEIVNLIGETDSVLSFNYTLTLEKIYKIPNIFHIHGSLPKKLIMGHSEDYNVQGDDFGINLVNEKYVKKYFKKTRKKTSNIISKNCDFFNKQNLEKVTDVYVLGHSMNGIDMPYFQEVIKLTHKNVVWHIVYYDTNDIDNFDSMTNKLGIVKKHFINWNEL